jgi:hypothetical protein
MVGVRVIGWLCVLSLVSGACKGGVTEPTTKNSFGTVNVANPAASTTLTKGTSFQVPFTVTFAQNSFTLYTVAFVRDDGVYSPPFACAGAGSSGGAIVGPQAVEVSGVLGPLPTGGLRTESQRFGNILYQFAKGHRVNAVLLLKRLPDANSMGPGCMPLGTAVPGFENVTEGTVFPAVADSRTDVTLNWFIQE